MSPTYALGSIRGGRSYQMSSLDAHPMNNLFRTLIAGYGAKKLGGGCFSTVLVFIVLFLVLGQC